MSHHSQRTLQALCATLARTNGSLLQRASRQFMLTFVTTSLVLLLLILLLSFASCRHFEQYINMHMQSPTKNSDGCRGMLASSRMSLTQISMLS
eukprot:272568-Amphidinium_carterae.1